MIHKKYVTIKLTSARYHAVIFLSCGNLVDIIKCAKTTPYQQCNIILFWFNVWELTFCARWCKHEIKKAVLVPKAYSFNILISYLCWAVDVCRMHSLKAKYTAVDLPLELSVLLIIQGYSCNLLIVCFIPSCLHTSAKVILYYWQFGHNSAKTSDFCFSSAELMCWQKTILTCTRFRAK